MNKAMVVWGLGMLTAARAMEHKNGCEVLRHSCVHAITQIERVADFVDERTQVVFFDIDDTVLMPRNNIAATTQWTIAFRNYLKTVYGTTLGAMLINSVITHYVIQALAVMEPMLVQEEVVGVINQLMSQGVPVIFLTGRPLASAEDTYRQLKKVHIDVSKQQGILEELCTFQNNDLSLPILCSQGVIVCNGNNKGKVLKNLFGCTGFWPQKFIVVDDDGGFLGAIETEFEDAPQTEFVGLHYHCPWINPVTFTDAMVPADLSVEIERMRDEPLDADGCSPH